jgi:hypothetical protein
MSLFVGQPVPISWVFRSGTATVSVEPYPGRPGVLVCGIDPAEPVDDDTVEALRLALTAWKVLFFRRPEAELARLTEDVNRGEFRNATVS